MYADRITPSMAQAIDETDRRRAKQIAYNTAHGVDPQPLRKKISDVTDMLAREDIDTAELLESGYRKSSTPAARQGSGRDRSGLKEGVSRVRNNPAPEGDLLQLITELSEQMHAAAAELQFELAGRLRDEIRDLKKELRQMQEATA